MNKGTLTDHVAETAGITKGQAADAVNAVFDGIIGTLKKGDKAAFVGFGTFQISERKARTGINPLTKQPIKIAAKNAVRFKAGTAFSEAVNNKKKKK